MPDASRGKAFVLSIRPTYIERILDGRKTIELRRRFPISAAPGSDILLYSTSPVQSIVAIASLESVLDLAVGWLWRKCGDAAAVTRQEFQAYFQGRARGYALHLDRIRLLDKPLHLSHLARRFGFSPPQSYCYWDSPITQLIAHGRVEVPS
jgi:predicted transcriptional regulator